MRDKMEDFADAMFEWFEPVFSFTLAVIGAIGLALLWCGVLYGVFSFVRWAL